MSQLGTPTVRPFHFFVVKSYFVFSARTTIVPSYMFSLQVRHLGAAHAALAGDQHDQAVQLIPAHREQLPDIDVAVRFDVSAILAQDARLRSLAFRQRDIDAIFH